MQSDRYLNSKTASTTCMWCDCEYRVMSSRAADSQVFCRRRCEVEARFWLYELLKALPGR
jgi:hypothetical protein